ncbi:hypothetical protein JCM15765_18180 [Paradesulfitobacterium aromaticivorans]
MNLTQRFKTDGTIDWGYVEFPFDVETEFGTRGQVKVIATFDGYEYRGSLARMGHHCHLIGLTKKVRAEIGKNPGEGVHVVIKQDVEPRTVELPEDFEKLLNQNPEAKMFFDKLSFTNRKEYVQWITTAKKVETRDRRLRNSIDKLLQGIKEP